LPRSVCFPGDSFRQFNGSLQEVAGHPSRGFTSGWASDLASSLLLVAGTTKGKKEQAGNEDNWEPIFGNISMGPGMAVHAN